MAYVDGFLLVVPKKKLAAYKKLAAKAGKIWMEYGALRYVETAGDDLQTMCGTPFPKVVKLKRNEAVVFSWIVYKSKAARNSINKKVMKDKRLSEMCDPNNMPFDVRRMSYGGFKTLVKF